MSQAFTSGNACMAYSPCCDQDSQVLDGAPQSICLYLAFQMSIFVGMLRKAVSRQGTDPLTHLFLDQQDLSGTAVAQGLLCEVAAALNVLFALKQRGQLGLKDLRMSKET